VLISKVGRVLANDEPKMLAFENRELLSKNFGFRERDSDESGSSGILRRLGPRGRRTWMAETAVGL